MSKKSFLPEDYLEQRVQRRTNFICLVLFVLVMAGVVGAFLISDRQRTELREQRKAVDSQFEEAAKRLEQLDRMQAQKQQMIRKAKVTGMLLERVPRTLVLAEIINNMPTTVTLTEISAITKQVASGAKPVTVMQRVKGQKAAEKADKEAGKTGPPEPEVKPVEVEMLLVGMAPTDVEVAQYMSALGQSAMFRNVELKYSEQLEVDKQMMRKFRVEFRIPTDLDAQQIEPKLVKRELMQNPMDPSIQINGEGRMVVPSERQASVPVKP
jgi:Tfp pilus assembly protein PilN